MNADDGLHARFEYGGLILECDEEAFARIRDHLAAEPSLARLGKAPDEWQRVRFLRITPPMPKEDAERNRKSRWLAWVPMLLASGISGVAQIVGYVVVYRWVMRAIGW